MAATPPAPPTPVSQPGLCEGEGAGACEITFLDPVNALQNGNAILTDPATLATLGKPVIAIAADSASRVVLRIRAGTVGDKIDITLNGDGSLSTVGGTENSLYLSQLTAVDTGEYPMTFAVYRAPSNFSRGAPSNDDNIDQRSVSFHVRFPDGTTVDTPLTILRPPVVLVHGAWGDESDWATFTPLISDPLRNFFVRRANYNYDLHGAITTSTPGYTPALLKKARGNALGFDFAAPIVLEEIDTAIVEFRQTRNAAAAQADVIAHSMGGTVSRALVNLLRYPGHDSFGAGYIHKLITFGTPHLGSPLAADLTQGNVCVRTFFAEHEHIALYAVSLPGPPSPNGCGIYTTLWCGGSGDLQPGSDALGRIQNGSGPTVPAALIAGITAQANVASLDNSLSVAGYLRSRCANDPVAQRFTAQGWRTEFGEDNDGIVSQTSQLAGFTATPVGLNPVPGVIHSAGLEGGRFGLGFTGPSEQASATSIAGIQDLVIRFLNEQMNGADFYQLH
jgi:pimeloyl-ACP methyl ester carboxylesterase